LADELSCRGIRPGTIEPGTKARASTIRAELVARYNAERVELESGGHGWSATGTTIAAIIGHLMASVWGAGTHTPNDRENAILRAVEALPGLCDKLFPEPQAITAETAAKRTRLTKSEKRARVWDAIGHKIKNPEASE